MKPFTTMWPSVVDKRMNDRLASLGMGIVRVAREFDGVRQGALGLDSCASRRAVESTMEHLDLDHGDTALVVAIATGDRRALARLYDRYAPMLLAVAQRLLRSRREAEDLLHDVFLEAWHRASGYDPARGTVRAWLLVRLRSRALDRHRAASDVHVPIDDRVEERALEGEDPALAPDRAAVRRALATLPSEQRAVLELGYFHGLSLSEIAHRTSTPIGTVKSRAATGLARLRAGLNPDGAR